MTISGDAFLNVLLRDSHGNTAGKDLHRGHLYCEGGGVVLFIMDCQNCQKWCLTFTLPTSLVFMKKVVKLHRFMTIINIL